jgi:hypothetical protein
VGWQERFDALKNIKHKESIFLDHRHTCSFLRHPGEGRDDDVCMLFILFEVPN